MGSPVPTREFGFSNTVNFFRHFSLYALVDYKTGGMIFNANERSRCQAANDNCARVNNPAARFPTTAADTILNREFAVYRQTAQVPPEFVQSTDFVKLREVSLSTVIPPRFLRRTGASSARFTLSGRNLGIWSDYEGADPEVNSYGGRNFVKIDAYAAPATRRITGALSLQF